jgi:hypothetical protein
MIQKINKSDFGIQYIRVSVSELFVAMNKLTQTKTQTWITQWNGQNVINLDSVYSEFDIDDTQMSSASGLSCALKNPCEALQLVDHHLIFHAKECESVPGSIKYYKVRTSVKRIVPSKMDILGVSVQSLLSDYCRGT